MKFNLFFSPLSPRNGVANGLMLAIVAALAVGVGVTGTLLWTQHRASAPAATSAPASPSMDAAKPPVVPDVVGLDGLPITPPANQPGAPPVTAPGTPPTTATPPSIAGMTSAQAALTLGNWHYDQQQWPQAIESYRAALSSGFDNPDVRTDYGNALRFSGQPKKALEQYLIAQKQDPTHEQSLFNQGGLWAFSLDDKPKALAAWRAYLKRFPQGQSAAEGQQFIAQNK